MWYSPWETNNHSSTQEIPRLLWNPKDHCRVHKGPPLDPIPGQMHPVHTFPLHFPKINSNSILSSTPRSSEWSLPFRFSNQNIVRISHVPRVLRVPPSSTSLLSSPIHGKPKLHNQNEVLKDPLRINALCFWTRYLVHSTSSYTFQRTEQI
jgi:hypothetical protein